MADLRIADAPEIVASDVQDGLKIPTGGFGNYTISTQTIRDWLVNYKDISTKTEVNTQYEYIQQQLASYINTGNKGYKTLAAAQADSANIPVNSSVYILNDPDASKNGLYQWDGLVFTKSPYDPITRSISYTDEKIEEVESALDLKSTNDIQKIPILSDGEGKSLVHFNTLTNTFEAVGLKESIFDEVNEIKATKDDRYIPVLTDSEGKVLIGWDKVLDKAVGFGSSSEQLIKNTNYKFFQNKPVGVEVNHLLSYGESLSVGATATAIISTSQPYLNTTFGFVSNGTTYSSPRKDVAPTSVQPLKELFYSPAPDGGTNRGETHCSGAANYATMLMLEDGLAIDTHKIFASTGGYGGATIASLAKGGSRYAALLSHITDAKALNPNKTYKILATPFIIGTNDAAAATSYSSFRTTFETLYTDLNLSVKQQTSQPEDLVFIVPQVSYGAKTQPQISKALYDLTQEHGKFLFATPLYHLPYDGDNIHLTNIGYKWLGAYIGRVYKQYITEGRYPDHIKPKSAYIKDNVVRIKFEAPMLPLQLDSTTLAITTNFGFNVKNGSTDVSISSVSVEMDEVIITLAQTPTTDLTVRYALDYIGQGLSFLNGASGNLRDSTQEKIKISNNDYPLYHVCPHFEMTAYLTKGI